MLKMRKIVLLFVGFSIFLLSHQAYSQDAEKLFKRCEQEGAATVINQFTREDWDLLAERIAAGDSSWIRASACLNHGFYYGATGDLTDYGKGEEDWGDYGWWVVTEAWVKALLKNPVAILKVDVGASLSGVCRLPIEADKGTIEFADKHLAKALASLERVEDEHLEVHKKACQLYLTHDHERVIKRLHERNEEERAGQ